MRNVYGTGYCRVIVRSIDLGTITMFLLGVSLTGGDHIDGKCVVSVSR